jgi:hypothetical protein
MTATVAPRCPVRLHFTRTAYRRRLSGRRIYDRPQLTDSTRTSGKENASNSAGETCGMLTKVPAHSMARGTMSACASGPPNHPPRPRRTRCVNPTVGDHAATDKGGALRARSHIYRAACR